MPILSKPWRLNKELFTVQYDFDAIINRKGTGCLKYDFHEQRGKSSDLMPLWVADMDFPLPPEVLEPIIERVNHGIFGYTQVTDEYLSSVLNWIEKHQGWLPQQEWLVTTPGVVFALSATVRAFTNQGDSVLIQQPVYYPFSNVILDNDRKLINAPLTYIDGSYAIDFEAFERAIVQNDVRLYILCNPHNPASRVWTREELTSLAEICRKHNVIVVSDEIHADFIWPGYEFCSYASLGEEFLNNCVVCTAPSKTFNIAGLQISNIFIPNGELRKRFSTEIARTGYDEPSLFGLMATRACYTLGEEWHAQVKDYIYSNICFMQTYLLKNVPQLRVVDPQGTYLVWVDCRGLGLDAPGLKRLIEDKARLWLDLGDMFGEDGTGFIRFNVACPRSILEIALQRLCAAVAEFQAD